jgi:hypothetical protein
MSYKILVWGRIQQKPGPGSGFSETLGSGSNEYGFETIAFTECQKYRAEEI